MQKAYFQGKSTKDMRKHQLLICIICWFLTFGITSQTVGQIVKPQFQPVGKNRMKITVWRMMDLKKSPNTSYYPIDREMSRLLIEGVKSKRIKPYVYSRQSNLVPMSLPEFNSRLKYYETSLGDTVELNPADLYKVELEEDVILTKDRSSIKHRLKSLSLFIPEGSSEATKFGDVPLATFKYKQVRRYFNRLYRRSLRKKSFELLKAFWFTPDDKTQHMSWATALEQHRFQAPITKYSNPQNLSVVSIVYRHYPKKTNLRDLVGREAMVVEDFIYEDKVPDFRFTIKEDMHTPYFVRLNRKKIRTTVWRGIDLTLEENKPYLNNFVGLLMTGIKNKQLHPYYYSSLPDNDGFTQPMPYKDFSEKLNHPMYPLQAKDIKGIELREYVTSKLNRKDVEHQIFSLSLVIPKGTNDETQLGSLRVVSFKYNEVAKYLKKMYKRRKNEAAWMRGGKIMSFAYALSERKFKSKVLKFSHPDDIDIFTFVYDKNKDLGSQLVEKKLLEKEEEIEKYLSGSE